MTTSDSNIKFLIEKSVLASPPDLLFKIINSLDSELSSRQIGEIVGHDQSISAQVLKLSNSSFFGFKGHIKTLDRAINILGTKTVRNIAVTTLLFAHTNKVRLWNLDIMSFWLHTFLVADITRELSQKVGLDGDESYIAGLLHDIGRLVLYAQRQEKADLFRSPHTEDDIMEYERKTWNIDSNALSRMLLEKWNIPEDTVAAIAGCRDYRSDNLLSKTIFIANEISSIVTDVYFKSTITYPVFARLLRDFKMSEEDFGRFSVQIPGIVERGKIIMRVMSKNENSTPVRRRLITKATLVTPCEFSLSKCLLELIGFTVDVVSPEEAAKYVEELKAAAELRKKEYDERLNPKKDEPEPPPGEDRKKEDKDGKKGFLSRLFAPGRKKQEESKVEESEEEEEKTKQVSWNPLVVFEQCEPISIDKSGVVSCTVLRDPSKLKGDPVPFFFTNLDIKTK